MMYWFLKRDGARILICSLVSIAAFAASFIHSNEAAVLHIFAGGALVRTEVFGVIIPEQLMAMIPVVCMLYCYADEPMKELFARGALVLRRYNSSYQLVMRSLARIPFNLTCITLITGVGVVAFLLPGTEHTQVVPRIAFVAQTLLLQMLYSAVLIMSTSLIRVQESPLISATIVLFCHIFCVVGLTTFLSRIRPLIPVTHAYMASHAVHLSPYMPLTSDLSLMSSYTYLAVLIVAMSILVLYRASRIDIY